MGNKRGLNNILHDNGNDKEATLVRIVVTIMELKRGTILQSGGNIVRPS